MKTLNALILSLLGIFLVTGCNTLPKSEAEQIYLRKGMAGSEIIGLLGDPLQIRKPSSHKEATETWVYEDSREYTRQVQADTREVPYINPITREESTRTEVINKLKTDRVTLTTELFLKDGRLIDWKETRRESSSFQE
jgi:hypothetical protein